MSAETRANGPGPLAEPQTDFIAEISSNHNGDLARCFDLISAAADCGCRAVKFQLFRIERLFAPEVLRVSAEHRRRRRWELPVHFLPRLADCARTHGLRFGCTPFDLGAVEQAAPHVDFLKIASYELGWPQLGEYCAATGLPLMISTGMANRLEIEDAVERLRRAGCTDLTLLHCLSCYPAPADACNLAAIGTLATVDPRAKVGWSDHSRDPSVIRAAVAEYGAQVVEFHLDLEGEGHEFGGGHCWLPRQISPVIAGQGEASSQCGGSGELDCTENESLERDWRADPDDGLRPLQSTRPGWVATQATALPIGPRIVFVPRGLGLGHTARCLAVAEALREGWHADCRFLIPDDPVQGSLLDRHGLAWQTAGGSVARPGGDWLESVVLQATDLEPRALVVDLDQPADEVVAALGGAGCPLVVLDQPDLAEKAMAAGPLQVIVPSLVWQRSQAPDNLVGGIDHMLLRKDVTRLRPAHEPETTEGPVLISFGGSDPRSLTEKAARAVAAAKADLRLQVIMGPGFADAQARASDLQNEIPGLQIIPAADPVEPLLAAAGLVITALGVTAGESMCLGVPVALLTNWPADRSEARQLHGHRLAWDLGDHAVGDQELAGSLASLLADPGRLLAQARAGWRMVDGRGAHRAGRRIIQIIAAPAGGEGDLPC